MTKLSDTDMELFLVECGWAEKNGAWRHPELQFDWPLEDAFRLQRGASAGARGPTFAALRAWARERKKKPEKVR